MQLLFTEACNRQDKQIRGFSTLCEEAALAHTWPGNARELKNRVERAVALAAGEWLMPADLFPDMPSSRSGSGDFVPLSEIRDAAERLSRLTGHCRTPPATFRMRPVCSGFHGPHCGKK